MTKSFVGKTNRCRFAEAWNLPRAAKSDWIRAPGHLTCHSSHVAEKSLTEFSLDQCTDAPRVDCKPKARFIPDMCVIGLPASLREALRARRLIFVSRHGGSGRNG